MIEIGLTVMVVDDDAITAELLDRAPRRGQTPDRIVTAAGSVLRPAIEPQFGRLAVLLHDKSEAVRLLA